MVLASGMHASPSSLGLNARHHWQFISEAT